MFIDMANIYVRAGKGGNGAVSFYRDRGVVAGGPDGGNGGKGGNIIFKVNDQLSTLINFKYKRRFIAPDGKPGGKNCRSGKNGKDIIIEVPRGTIVKNLSTKKVIIDLTNKDSFTIAKGGIGGFGNRHFVNSRKRTPKFSKPGSEGQEFYLILELKLLADVGLVGLPNVGKSAFIASVSNAKPKIANYPFTTLNPILGVVKTNYNKSFIIADIPGLIEGASHGAGLGHEFLKHIERCRLILHIVDLSNLEGHNPIEDFNKINFELKNFNPELSNIFQIVLANKCDIAEKNQVDKFKKYISLLGYPIFEISALTKLGLQDVINFIVKKLDTMPLFKKEYLPEIDNTDINFNNKRKFNIKKENGIFIIEANWLFNILKSVNLEDSSSLGYFQHVIKSSGIDSKLKKLGIKDGDIVRIFNLEFEYLR